MKLRVGQFVGPSQPGAPRYVVTVMEYPDDLPVPMVGDRLVLNGNEPIRVKDRELGPLDKERIYLELEDANIGTEDIETWAKHMRPGWELR